jgi:hypothetical protein
LQGIKIANDREKVSLLFLPGDGKIILKLDLEPLILTIQILKKYGVYGSHGSVG